MRSIPRGIFFCRSFIRHAAPLSDLCAVGADSGANARAGPADVGDCQGDRQAHRRAVHGEGERRGYATHAVDVAVLGSVGRDHAHGADGTPMVGWHGGVRTLSEIDL